MAKVRKNPVVPKFPARPEAAARTAKGMIEGDAAKTMSRIPPIMALQCKVYLHHYFGTRKRMYYELMRADLQVWLRGLLHCSQLWLSDRFGFTKLYPLHSGIKLRHGRLCSGSPNCSDHNCIDRSVPKWFKVMVRWKDLDDL